MLIIYLFNILNVLYIETAGKVLKASGKNSVETKLNCDMLVTTKNIN